MANNTIQFKRTSTSGLLPNTTNSANSSYIPAGSFAVNLTDKKVIASDGSLPFEVGANLTNQNITGNINLANNGAQIRFATVNSAAYSYFSQQNDDNFVFYTTNSSYGARPIWSVFANSSTSAFSIGAPVTITGANLNIGSTALYANGTSGTSGQILTSNGTATYWSSPGTSSVNTAAQWTWSNTHTFQANVTFGNSISIPSGNSTVSGGMLFFNGLSDANWKMGRNTLGATKWYYSNNTTDIIIAGSNLEGFTIGQVGAASVFETGYAGTFIAANVTIGNSSVKSTINATTFSGSANNTSYVNGKLEGNLNVNSSVSAVNANNSTYFNGYTWGAPAAIGGTTANSGNFTSLSSANVTTTTNLVSFGTSFFSASNGNIGINSSAPNNTLTVQVANSSALGVGLDVVSLSNGYFRLASASSTAFLPSFSGQSTLTTSAYGAFFTGRSANNTDTSVGVMTFSARYNDGTSTGTSIGSSQIAFQFNNYVTPVLTVMANGMVNAATFSVGTSFTANSTLANVSALNVVNRINTASQYITNSLGINTLPNSTSKINIGGTDTSDASFYNIYNSQTYANTATTTSRNKVGYTSILTNQDQFKSADGLTQYAGYIFGNQTYIYNGSASTGGDATGNLYGYAVYLYNYANGTTTNTVGTAYSYYSSIQPIRSPITQAIGTYNEIIQSNSSYANIGTAFGTRSSIVGNTTGGSTIGTGYLFYGTYSSALPTTAYGVYINGEQSNYLSANLNVGVNVNAASHTVGTSFTANSTLVNAAALNVVNQVNTATLYAATSANIGTAVVANSTGVWSTGTVNAASHTVGTTFTANATLVNAAALNVVNQVNTATLYAATSANVGANVQSNTSAYFVGNSTISTTITSSSISVTNAVSVNTSYTTFGNINGTTTYGVEIDAGDPSVLIRSSNATSNYQRFLLGIDHVNQGPLIASPYGAYGPGPITFRMGTVGGSYSEVARISNTGAVNAASFSVGSSFVANSTGITGTLLTTSQPNITSNNSTYFGGYTWGAPAAIGGTTANSASFTSVLIDGVALKDSVTTTTAATTQVTLFSYSNTAYGSAEVVIQATQGTERHLTKLLVTANSTTAVATEFGTIYTSGSLFTADVSFTTGTIAVLITPASATSTTFKANYTLIAA